MKVRNLIETVGNDVSLEVDGQRLTEDDLDLEIETISIRTKDESKGVAAQLIDKKTKDNLETLGYRFEVGI